MIGTTCVVQRTEIRELIMRQCLETLCAAQQSQLQKKKETIQRLNQSIPLIFQKHYIAE
jgi:hypothetical protein